MTFRSPPSLTLAATAWIAFVASACLPTLAAEEEGAAARDLRPVALQREIEGVQPMTGIVLWDTSPHRRSDAIQLEFSYIGYGQLVAEDGADDWSLVEDKLDAIAERGHQAVFRFYLAYVGRPTQVPRHIQALPDYEDVVGESEGKETHFPDWSHPALQGFVLDFHRAFAERYDRDPRLAFVQVGFGLWAEYHIYQGPFELGKTFPDRAYQGRFLRHLAEVYRETPFSISVDAAKPRVTPFEEDPELLEIPFGVFDDSFLNEDHNRWNLPDWEKLGRDRHLRAPAGGEFSYYTDHDQRNALGPEGPHGESFEEAARRFGISYLIGDGQPNYQPMERIREAGMACGYRFRVVSFESAPGRSRVGVRNEGIAAIYHDAFVAVDGVRSGESLRRLAPGEEAVFEIASGGEAPELMIESDRLVPGQRIEYAAALDGLLGREAGAAPEASQGAGETPPSATPQPATSADASASEGDEASTVGEAPLDRVEPEAGTGDAGVVASIFQLVGGIGLFLMGMVLLTEGIKAYAGESLRFALMRFAGTPVKSFASGALVTTLVQSSSATTVTVIGFVSAGLLAFPQAIGVILGASLGTTATGWVVAGLGLKVSVGLYALPLVGIGAFLRLLARGRAKALGTFLAGFGLIFIGIDFMQLGMRSLGEGPALSSLPAEGLKAHLLAMLVGIVLTVAMQSSSAAVATTLTALHTGAVNFEQAASVVIGAAVGTTVTGVIAAIGGTVPAKRTALAHVVFNLATGVIAVLLLPLLLWVVGLGQQHLGLDGGAMSLAAFHTIFIALGVALFLPFVDRFARVIERLLPDRGPALTRHLDRTVLRAPSVALEASRRALVLVSVGTFRILRDSLGFGSRPRGDQPGPAQLREALERIRAFLPQIPAAAGDEPVSDEGLSQLHSIDHLERLLSKLSPPKLEGAAQEDPGETLRNGAQMANRILELGIDGLGDGLGTSAEDETESASGSSEAGDDWLAALESKAHDLAELRRMSRPHILREASLRGMDPAAALDQLDLLRWYDRIAFHAWRVCHHLGRGGSRPVEPPGEEAAEGLGAEVFDDDELPNLSP